MLIKYIHKSAPEIPKVYDTEKAFKNPNNPKIHNTQQEFDDFELQHFAKSKVNGDIISYEIIR